MLTSTNVQTVCDGSSRLLFVCGKDMEFLVLLHSSAGSIGEPNMLSFGPCFLCWHEGCDLCTKHILTCSWQHLQIKMPSYKLYLFGLLVCGGIILSMSNMSLLPCAQRKRFFRLDLFSILHLLSHVKVTLPNKVGPVCFLDGLFIEHSSNWVVTDDWGAGSTRKRSKNSQTSLAESKFPFFTPLACHNALKKHVKHTQVHRVNLHSPVWCFLVTW